MLLNHSMFSPHSFTSKRAVSPNPYLDNPVNGYACPTGMALHYDDVPINGTVRTHLLIGDTQAEILKTSHSWLTSTMMLSLVPAFHFSVEQ